MSGFTNSVLDPFQTSTPKPQKPREMFGGTFGGFDDIERVDTEKPLDSGFKEPRSTEFKSGTIHFDKTAILEGTLTSSVKVAEKTTEAVKEISSIAIDLFLQDIFGIGSKNEQPKEKSPEEQKKQAEAAFRKEAFRTQSEDSNRARMQKLEEHQKDSQRLGVVGQVTKLLEAGIGSLMMAVKKIEWKTQNKKNSNSAAGIASGRMSDLSLNKVAEGGSMLSSTGGNAG